MTGARYVELQCTSHFSFLRGASSCEELFEQAALLGIEALAIVDRNSLAANCSIGDRAAKPDPRFGRGARSLFHGLARQLIDARHFAPCRHRKRI